MRPLPDTRNHEAARQHERWGRQAGRLTAIQPEPAFLLKDSVDDMPTMLREDNGGEKNLLAAMRARSSLERARAVRSPCFASELAS